MNRPNIILRCDHGGMKTDEQPQFVQCYEWRGLAWERRDKKVTTISYPGEGDWLTHPEAAMGYEHHETRCKSRPRCRKQVRAQADNLMWAFHLMVKRGEIDVTLDRLQQILEDMPRALKWRR